MNRVLLIAAILIFLASAGFAVVEYNVKLSGDSADISLKMEIFSSEGKVNLFEASIILPEGAEVLSISDSKGEIKDYGVQGKILSFKTNYSVAKDREIVEIKMHSSNARDEQFAPLHSSDLSFSSFEGTDTIATIEGQDFISFQPSFGFKSGFSENKITMHGKGPGNVKIFYSGEGKKTNYFVLFNSDYSMQKENEQYYIIPRILGILPPFQRFPVLVLEDAEYNMVVNGYSDGTFKRGGLIIVRKSIVPNSGPQTILHETVHGFNSFALNWNQSNATWFDEGIAKFAEWTVAKELGEMYPNLFFGEKSWREGNVIYTLQPQSSLKELQEYYQQGKTFMRSWNPDSGNREFGYAFSELFLREQAMKGNSVIFDAYRKFVSLKESAETADELNEVIETIFGEEIAPCKSTDLGFLKECVRQLNEFNPGIPEKRELLMLSESSSGVQGIQTVSDLEKQQVLLNGKAFKEKSETLIEAAFKGLKAKAPELREQYLALVGK